jgi:hypothetical protein
MSYVAGAPASHPTTAVDHMRTTPIPRNHGAFTHCLHINAFTDHIDAVAA